MDIQKLKEEFISELRKREANIKCPICGKEDLVVEGPFSQVIQGKPGRHLIGGPAIPTLGVVCKNCGYLREFALGSLGLLEDLKKNVEMEDK